MEKTEKAIANNTTNVAKTSKCTSGCSTSSDANDYNTILHPFTHQVGGHTQLMLLDQTTVCKPLIQRELLFYLNIPPELQRFVPKYKGVVQIRQVDGCPILYHPIRGTRLASSSAPSSFSKSSSSDLKCSQSQPELRVQISTCNDQRLLHRDVSLECSRSSDYSYSSKPSQRYFLMLENIASRYHLPCILDLKMGTRMHGDDASDEKRHRQMAKCAATTSASLGVRVCGMQVYQADLGVYLMKDKYWGRKLDEDGLRGALRQFFFNGNALRTFVIDAVLSKLKAMKEAVEQQTSFRFYSTSLLIAYEGCVGRRGSRTSAIDEDPSEDDSSSVDFDDWHRQTANLMPPSSMAHGRKRHNSSSGDDEDSSLDSSIELTRPTNVARSRSFFSDYSRPNRRVLYKCSQRQHHDNYSRSEPNVDVRMIDFAHTVLATSRNASPARTVPPILEESLLSPGLNANAKYEGPDKGFLQGLNSLIQVLTEVRREGHDRGEDEMEDSDCDDEHMLT